MTFTPPTLAKRWGCTPETVLALIRAGRLTAFTLSPPGSKRPRWRITEEAVLAFERGEQSQLVPKADKRQRRRSQPRVEFYTCLPGGCGDAGQEPTAAWGLNHRCTRSTSYGATTFGDFKPSRGDFLCLPT